MGRGCGIGSVSNVGKMGRNFRVLESSFSLMFDSHDWVEASCQKCAEGTVEPALPEQQLSHLLGCLAKITLIPSMQTTPQNDITF